ncbi:MAG: carotenoid biosynthesis protein [Chloroflexaceae bacterium]|nr:carotenoid biosynthesis protein [Chloroflexaceae bacterium]
MSIFRHPVRSLLFGLLALYLFIYPGSLVLVALDRVPVWGTWMGGAMLIMLGTIMGLWLVVNYGRRGMVATALILFISWFIEHLGSTTGFPFGSYSYTDVLQPKIIGMVPLAIPFAWLLVVPAAVGVTERLLEKGGRVGIATKVMMAASFALLLDVTIEPFAVHINNYWTWEYAGGYYGIPMSNFVAWWFTSLILAIVMLTLIVPRHEWGGRKGLAEVRRARVLPWLPPLLYVLNLTMFVFGNLGHGQWAAAAIGTLILAYLAFDWFEPGLVRWVLGKRRESGT